MDTNNGGNPPTRHETAAELARKKVLAVYSSTLESLKKNSGGLGPTTAPHRDNFGSTSSHHGDRYLAPPVPGIVYSDQDDFDVKDARSNRAGNDYEQIHYETTDFEAPYASAASPAHASQPQPTAPVESVASYQSGDTTSALKDTHINQTVVNEEWQKYHSAWQNYYQNYYNDYYAKAAQNYLMNEKLKNERVAGGKVRKARRFRRLIPLFAGIFVTCFLLFLQYNRLIFAPLMAYVSPNSEEVASSIEAVNPTVTQAVSPDPRLIIPKLNVDVPVAFGISTSAVDDAMNRGVAQFMIPGANAMPGEIGNLVISGHSAGDIYSSNPYKFIFSGLERLAVGDLLYVNYNSVRYTYQMTRSEVVEPTNVAALIYPTDKPILTLITCTPLGTSRYRLLIVAEQISPAYEYTEPDPDSTTTIEPDTDTTMPANSPTFFENLFR